MTREELREQVLEILQSIDDADAVKVNNAYCEANHYFEDSVYFIDEIDEYLRTGNYSPSEILGMAINGGYNHYSEFFRDNIYGVEFFDTFDLVSNGVTSVEELADFVIEEGGNIQVEELQELFDEYADEQEEAEEEDEETA